MNAAIMALEIPLWIPLKSLMTPIIKHALKSGFRTPPQTGPYETGLLRGPQNKEVK